MSEIIGSQDVYLTPLSQRVNAENETVTFNYVGEHSALLAKEPKKDWVWNESGGKYTVLNATVTRHPGGMGEMTVACIPYKVGGAGEPTSDHYEIQFVETSQQLAFHEDFPDDEDAVEQWKCFLMSPEHVQQAMKYCPDPSDEAATEELDSALEDWAELYNKGIHEYMIYLPVVVRVRTYNLSPEKEVAGVGRLKQPEIVPTGYAGDDHWLKTGDNSIQEPGSGKWTRTETWTYAEEWPALLYKNGGGNA